MGEDLEALTRDRLGVNERAALICSASASDYASDVDVPSYAEIAEALGLGEDVLRLAEAAFMRALEDMIDGAVHECDSNAEAWLLDGYEPPSKQRDEDA